VGCDNKANNAIKYDNRIPTVAAVPFNCEMTKNDVAILFKYLNRGAEAQWKEMILESRL